MSSARQQTCDVCRDRKVRCDREEPKCGRCVRLRLPCGYSRSTRPAQDDLLNQMVELQSRLARAEALLASSATSAPGLQTILPKDDSVNPRPPTLMALNETQLATNQGAESFDLSLPVEDELLHDIHWALDWDMPDLDYRDLRPTTAIDNPAINPVPLFSEIDAVKEEDLVALHAQYFDLVHATYPFVSQQRLVLEQHANSDHLPDRKSVV